MSSLVFTLINCSSVLELERNHTRLPVFLALLLHDDFHDKKKEGKAWNTLKLHCGAQPSGVRQLVRRFKTRLRLESPTTRCLHIWVRFLAQHSADDTEAPNSSRSSSNRGHSWEVTCMGCLNYRIILVGTGPQDPSLTINPPQHCSTS